MATRSSRARAQEIRQFILENVSSHPADITNQVTEKYRISRQAAHRYILQLVRDGTLHAVGETKDKRYLLAPIAEGSFTLALRPGLQEDVVWRESVRPLLQSVPPEALAICEYVFSEMFNNAIDHSGGSKVAIWIKQTFDEITMVIQDDGVGIFNKIRTELGLTEEREAILELVKGKFTTDPSRHTGEGIFFTSRAVDQFTILSGKLSFMTHRGTDWLIEGEKDPAEKGTAVVLQINPKTKRTLREIFDQYSSGQDDYGFTRTRVPVILARYGDENLVSRSQAKRLCARFEKFQEVILDFAGVESIGQAFADEIFRVFANEHPQVRLSPVHANDEVEKMIKRARGNKQE